MSDEVQGAGATGLKTTIVGIGSQVQTLPLHFHLACQRFEAVWRTGYPLALERVLDEAGVADDERPHLFRALLHQELDLRSGRREQPSLDDYEARFPDHACEVATVFAEFLERIRLREESATSTELAPGTEIRTIARYRIVGTHAEGGLGKVLLAIDETLDRESAIKEIRAGRDNQTARARFAREAAITGRLEHPGIVPVHGMGVYPDGRPFYAMRLIRGESLRQAIVRFHESGGHAPAGAPAMALRELLRRFIAVCDAIGYAHSMGVIHRDLKPENIMLGPFGETLVVDWGLAKSLHPTKPGAEPSDDGGEVPPDPEGLQDSGGSGFKTRDGQVLGTVCFMSPEQARADHRTGPASDIYSLGATLFDLLTGKAPFAGTGDVSMILHRVMAGDFARPRRLEPKVPRPLEAICLKAMALWTKDRYTTVGDLAADLRRWLADEPVAAWTEPWPMRARRWLSRHRTLAAALGAALFVTVIGATAFAWRRLLNDAVAEARAGGRVSTIAAADPERLPGLIENDGVDYPRLRRKLELKFNDPGLDRESRLRVAIALGPVNPKVERFLGERLLDANLEMLPLICQVLGRVDRQARAATLRKVLEDEREAGGRLLRAACALAQLDPPRSAGDDRRWRARAPIIVGEALDAIGDDLHQFRPIVDLLMPARRTLFAALADRFRDVPRGEFDPRRAEGRGNAANILDRYAETPDELAELIQDTLFGPRHVRFMAKLRAMGEPAIAALDRALQRDPPLDLVGAPAEPKARKEFFAARKARVAAALEELRRRPSDGAR